MTGRAGRRGKDKIGFALVAVPESFMDVRQVARLVSAPPADVFTARSASISPWY
jgi:ATP-dependent RNA helicase HelY